MPPRYRQRLWASVPLHPIARAAVFQVLAAIAMIAHTEPGSPGCLAIVLAAVLSLVTLPLGRLAARLAHDERRLYWWSGRVWAAGIPTIIAATMGDAYDGTGPAFAESVCAPPFALAAMVGVSLAIGAQGALLSVPRDQVVNIAVLLFAMSAIKLNATYSHAYLALHVFGLGSIFLGYTCVAKYADLHQAVREAAEAVVVGAAAREAFVVTDAGLHILAVNRRLLEMLGYADHELVGKPVTDLVVDGESLGNDHASVRRKLFEAASRKECPDGHVWSVRAKNSQSHPVRITLGQAHCPVNGTKFFTAMFSCMRLEQRNAQLCAEKERLQWEVASHHDGEEDPRELLGATVPNGTHRTLGEMRDQATTDEAVSCAQSFDHVDSSASPTVPRRTLVAPAPAKTPSSGASIVSLKSSVMDTISQAAKKSPTRAPPPPKKESRLPRPKKVCSEPSAPKPKAGNKKSAPPKRAVSAIELDPRERG